MGGHIEVWSKPGEGAKFTLYLGKNALPPNHSNHQ
jgi:signal transduction histidine kinase